MGSAQRIPDPGNNPKNYAPVSDDAVAACDATDFDFPLSSPQVASIVLDKRVAAVAVARTRWRALARRGGGRDAFILASTQLSSDLADYDSLRIRGLIRRHICIYYRGIAIYAGSGKASCPAQNAHQF